MKCLLLTVAMLLAFRAFANEAEDALRTSLSERFPQFKIHSIRKLDKLDLFEVVSDANRIFYIDRDGGFALTGDLFDLNAKTNLTEQRRDELNTVDFARLPLDKAVVRVRGDGARKLAIFADPDCPFCQQVERELLSVSNVTVYVFLYPISSLHPDAPRKARAVWCAEDQGVAWDALLLQGKEPEAASEGCVDPLTEIAELADSFHIDGTPGLIFSNGRLVAGAISAQEVEALLGMPPKSTQSAGSGDRPAPAPDSDASNSPRETP
jgi:thiol:disulfide interchange protein DsbC